MRDPYRRYVNRTGVPRTAPHACADPRTVTLLRRQRLPLRGAGMYDMNRSLVQQMNELPGTPTRMRSAETSDTPRGCSYGGYTDNGTLEEFAEFEQV